MPLLADNLTKLGSVEKNLHFYNSLGDSDDFHRVDTNSFVSGSTATRDLMLEHTEMEKQGFVSVKYQ